MQQGARRRDDTRSRGTSLLCRSDHVGAPPLQVSRHLLAPDARPGLGDGHPGWLGVPVPVCAPRAPSPRLK